MAEAQSIPQKSFYRASEVCQFTDTQPYVLRFWESEFPQLNPGKSPAGQPVYKKKDIDLVLRIKQLLYEEEYTLEAARKQLARETGKKGSVAKGKAPKAREAPKAPRREETPAQAPDAAYDTVSRNRYEDAVDEIAHLRLLLNEAESNLRRTEAALHKSEEEASLRRQRVDATIGKLEELLERLTV